MAKEHLIRVKKILSRECLLIKLVALSLTIVWRGVDGMVCYFANHDQDFLKVWLSFCTWFDTLEKIVLTLLFLPFYLIFFVRQQPYSVKTTLKETNLAHRTMMSVV